MNRTRILSGSIVLAAVALLASGGCATLKGEKSLTESLPWIGKKKEEKPYPNPAKMAVTWTPDVIFRPGSTPTRGFGGRVFFYDEKMRPVPVNGELAIHGFEEVASGQTPKVRRFAFTPEQFTEHFSQCDLGASYSIWVPWDAAGGPEARVTLVPSFRAVEGKLVQGTGATILLPGRSERAPMEPQSPSDLPLGMPEPTGLPASSGLTTTTIPAGGMGLRMARLQAGQPAPRGNPPATVLPATHLSPVGAPSYQVPAAYQGPAYQAPGQQAQGHQAQGHQVPGHQAPAYNAPPAMHTPQPTAPPTQAPAMARPSIRPPNAGALSIADVPHAGAMSISPPPPQR